MKKFYLLFATAITFVVLTSMTPLGEKITRTFSATTVTVNDTPILPDVPFQYEREVPDFIQNFFSGWGSSTPSNSFETVTNDGATLGRVLFYDKKLSLDETISCGTCHIQEFSFADGLEVSEGIMGTMTTRNSLHINDLAWRNSPELFWDGRHTVLEDMVIDPIINPDELGLDIVDLIDRLNNTEYYEDLFTDAFGTPAITEERIADAISQFIRSIASFESKFDVGIEQGFGNFTDSEQAGHMLFEQDCGFCHAAPHFGSSEFSGVIFGGNFTNGLDAVSSDPGMGGWTNDPFFDGVFKTPTLRNIEVTQPYMHDGRFETLEEVVDFYSEDLQPHPNSFFLNWSSTPGNSFTGFDYTDEEKADLVNFMKTLTDQTTLTDPKWSDPFEPETTSITDPHLFEDVTVFPNPAHEVTYISIQNSSSKEYDITLSNLSGQTLQRVAGFQGNQYALSTADLANGIYMIEIRQADNLRVIKLAVH